MTNEEKFREGTVVYQTEDGDYILELWAASTKHPDVVFHFRDFKKSEFVDEKHQVFQWLLECASKLTFPSHAKDLAEYALSKWCTWEKNEG